MSSKKAKPKNAKKSPPPKGADDRVFSATFDASGTLTAVSYRGTVPANTLKRPQVGNLVRLMFVVGKELAKLHYGDDKTSILFEQSEANKSFRSSVLTNSTTLGWFKSLFDIKSVSDSPFNSAAKDFGINLAHKNAPIAVCITIDGKTIDSRKAQPDEFNAVPKTATTAATADNYAAALGKVVMKAATDFNRHLSQYRHREEEPFKYAQQVMNEITSTHEPTCLDMHLMSVIPPSAWYRDDDWSAHHTRVRKLAEDSGENNLDRRQRRFHVLDAALLENPVELLLLTDLLLYDLRYRIESRILLVKQDNVTSPEGIPSVDGVLLMDYGIFSTGTGLYRVIISDIRPFGKTAPTNFQICQFPSLDLQALYYFKRHNWHNAWWGKAKGVDVIHTVEVLQRLLKIADDTKLAELPSLWFFKDLNKAKGGVFGAVKAAVQQLIKKADVNHGKRDELKFRKWFEEHGKTFRDSLKANGTK